jgi:hypothetical protein
METVIHHRPSTMLAATGIHKGVLRGAGQDYFDQYIQQVQRVTLRSSDDQMNSTRANVAGPFFVILIGGHDSIVEALSAARNFVFVPADGAMSIRAHVDSMDGTVEMAAVRTVQATEKHLQNVGTFGKGVLTSIKAAVKNKDARTLKAGFADAHARYAEEHDVISYTMSRFTFVQLYSGPLDTPQDLTVSLNGSLSAPNHALTLKQSPGWG